MNNVWNEFLFGEIIKILGRREIKKICVGVWRVQNDREITKLTIP